jgi:transcriptional regulator with XRE-family HTH domain
MGANIEHALRPAEIVARRVVEARKSRGWSQAQLVDELAELGYVKSRPTISKLEAGDYRGVSVDDLFALSAALGIAPVFLLAPLEDESPVAIAPRVQVPAWVARAWIRAEIKLPMLPDVDLRQIPESELVRKIETWFARGMTPVVHALAKDSLHERAVEIAAELRNPPPTTEGQDDNGNDR